MNGANQTIVTGVCPVGATRPPQPRDGAVCALPGHLLCECAGNALLIGLNVLDPRLHTPMYFFLSNLALMDICGTSSFGASHAGQLPGNPKHHLPGCALQMYLTLALGSTECVLLATWRVTGTWPSASLTTLGSS